MQTLTKYMFCITSLLPCVGPSLLMRDIGIILSIVTPTSDLTCEVLQAVSSVDCHAWRLSSLETLLLQLSFMGLLPLFCGSPFGAFLNSVSWLMALLVLRQLGFWVNNSFDCSFSYEVSMISVNSVSIIVCSVAWKSWWNHWWLCLSCRLTFLSMTLPSGSEIGIMRIGTAPSELLSAI